ELAAVGVTVEYPLPCRPLLVNQPSGTPSEVDWFSPPCRWTTVGIGPVKGLICMPCWSGSAQWMVWSMVRYFRSTGDAGRLLTYLTVIALPFFASTVTPGYCGLGLEPDAPIAYPHR